MQLLVNLREVAFFDFEAFFQYGNPLLQFFDHSVLSCFLWIKVKRVQSILNDGNDSLWQILRGLRPEWRRVLVFKPFVQIRTRLGVRPVFFWGIGFHYFSVEDRRISLLVLQQQARGFFQLLIGEEVGDWSSHIAHWTQGCLASLNYFWQIAGSIHDRSNWRFPIATFHGGKLQLFDLVGWQIFLWQKHCLFGFLPTLMQVTANIARR